MKNDISHKKSILNFNEREWIVDMPAASPRRAQPVPPEAPPVQPNYTYVPQEPVPVVIYPATNVEPTDYMVPEKKKTRKWPWIILIICVIFVGAFVSFILSENEEPVVDTQTETEKLLAGISNGDVIEFGSYPQSLVTDETVLSDLADEESGLNWVSYNYHSGNETDAKFGSCSSSDFMKYADVKVGEKTYRAVRFTEYRADYTPRKGTTDCSTQYENGYYINEIYWFEFEPLKWKVLDADEGLLLCENIITSTEFESVVIESYVENGYDTPTEYENSNLNFECRSFYNFAFSAEERNYIQTISSNEDETITDHVFVLSYFDVFCDKYDVLTPNKRAKATDYSQCQGVYVDKEKYAWWWLSTAENGSRTKVDVAHREGRFETYEVTGTDIGLRPAIKVSKTAIS